jgi:hypothetical protein
MPVFWISSKSSLPPSQVDKDGYVSNRHTVEDKEQTLFLRDYFTSQRT